MRRILAVVVVIGVLALLWGLQAKWETSGVRRSLSNVLLISVDGMRLDHFTSEGYPRPTTTRLDQIARSGVRFTRAVSQSPRSLESHASLFTGTSPSVHGVSRVRDRVLDDEILTLAEMLEFFDYHTAAFVGGGDLDEKWQVGRGFEHWERMPDLEAKDFSYKIFACNRWLSTFSKDERFFLFCQTTLPRPPFGPPYPYSRQFDPDYTDSQSRAVTLENLKQFESGAATLDATEFRHIVAQYDGEVATVDYYVGTWLERLFGEGGGYRDNTLVVFVSTVGQELFEHGYVSDDSRVTLCDSTLAVPVIFWVPGMSGRVVSAQVRLIDVMPTILDLLGLPIPEELQGVSLVSRMDGSEGTDLPAFSELATPTFTLHSVSLPPYRLVSDPRLHEDLLFDQVHDPLNQINLVSEKPDVAKDLRRRIEEQLERNEKDRPTGERAVY